MQADHLSADAPQSRIGAVAATMLVAGNMIGSGIFLLPTTAAAFGSMIVIGWIAVVIGALLLAGVFLQLSRIDPHAEMHGHVRHAFGGFAGWQSSFAYWVGAVIGNIAIAVAVAGYIGYFLPALTQGWANAAATIGVMTVLTGINLWGPALVARLGGALLVVGLLPVLIVAVAGWHWFEPSIFLDSWNVTGRPPIFALPASLGLLFWAFLGLESASVVAARVRDPGRNVPIATIGGVLIAAAVYVAACTVLTGILPARTLATGTAPVALVFERLVGPIAGSLVALCAIAKASGTLGGWILLTAETARDGADAGLFPRIFGRTCVRGIPVQNLAISLLAMAAIAVATLSPTIGRQFGILVNVSVLFAMTAYIWCCLALVKRNPGPLGRIVALAAMLFCIAVILTTEWQLLLWCAAFLVVSPIYYIFFVCRASLSRAAVT